MSVTPSARTVSDVMVRRPKTLAADATVADARRALEHSSVKLLLLVDGGRFRGAVSEIPADADPRDAALTYADAEPPIARAELTVSAALDRLEHRPSGRLVVLDDQEMLLGLVCLTPDGKGFCGTPAPAHPDSDLRSS
jgi:CBS domain-containing protein